MLFSGPSSCSWAGGSRLDAAFGVGLGLSLCAAGVLRSAITSSRFLPIRHAGSLPCLLQSCLMPRAHRAQLRTAGGVSVRFVVNNPGMAAYAEAHSLYPDASEFLIISVGTGDRDDRITYREAKGWGLLWLGKTDRSGDDGQRIRGGRL